MLSDNTKFVISGFMDLIGMGSYLIPIFGELFDIPFAPIQWLWIKIAYKTTLGATLGGLEEFLPFTDIIPSAIINHIFYIRSKNLNKYKE